jgi:hypothetical protein
MREKERETETERDREIETEKARASDEAQTKVSIIKLFSPSRVAEGRQSQHDLFPFLLPFLGVLLCISSALSDGLLLLLLL